MSALIPINGLLGVWHLYFLYYHYQYALFLDVSFPDLVDLGFYSATEIEVVGAIHVHHLSLKDKYEHGKPHLMSPLAKGETSINFSHHYV